MTRTEIFTVVKRNIALVIENARGEVISEDQSMRDLGADSLEVVEVVSRSMKELRIKLPRTALAEVGNLKELVDLFEAHAVATAN